MIYHDKFESRLEFFASLSSQCKINYVKDVLSKSMTWYFVYSLGAPAADTILRCNDLGDEVSVGILL